MARIDELMAALADPVRRGVVDRLRRRPQRAGELAAALQVSAPQLSRHLRVLRQAGVVDEQRPAEDARVKVLRLRREPFAALQAWLDQVQAFWTDQLASFRAHAEQAARGRRL